MTNACQMSPKALPSSIKKAQRSLRKREITCKQLVENYFLQIKKFEPKINSFITSLEENALHCAKMRDSELLQGRERGPLHGIPITLKDNYDLKNIKTTVGTKLLKSLTPEKNAVITELLASSGAIIIGKTNMNELAAGVTGTNKDYGDVHNPWRYNCSPGGSSGGSAAAVAANFCLGSTGTDTGGSLRIPASWCGVSTIRSTPGLIDKTGIFPRSPSLDIAGPIAKSAEDVAILFNIMANNRAPQCLDAERLSGLRVGVIKDYAVGDSDDYISRALRHAANTLSALGAVVVDATPDIFHNNSSYLDLFNSILLYEFYEILKNKISNIETVFEKCGTIVCRNIADARKITKKDYQNALRKRVKFSENFENFLSHIDILLTPTTPAVAPNLNASRKNFTRSRQFVLPSSIAGLPSIAIPYECSASGLPIGLQFIGHKFTEDTLLQAAIVFQKNALGQPH